MHHRFVIAGGPGSGKSSLLHALSMSGEICYPEISRRLIREQHASGGDMLPWRDLRGFALECARRMILDIDASARHRRCFFDRGLPDLIGYLTHGGQKPPAEWLRKSDAYARTVFFAPPWRQIFVQDSERPQTFQEASALGAHVRDAYSDCGFRVVELMRGTVEERAEQVLRHIASLTGSA